jgi:type VI secretion system ImpM family protein
MTEAMWGYYGKLPLSPEFLRLHAAGQEVRELDEWFECGIQYAKAKAGSSWPSLVAQADIWNFLFVPEGNGRVVCGTVFASRDRAGRSFPFFIFLLLECPRVPPAPWLIPLKCRLFLEKARPLLQQLRADLDWDTFRERAESLSTEVDPDAATEAGFYEYLSHTTIAEFCTRLFGPGNETRQHDYGQAYVIPRRPVREPFGKEACWGRQLPLLKGQKAEAYDVPFWLELHARWCGVNTGPLPSSVTFWNRNPSKVEPCVLLSLGCPSPRLARFLVTPDVIDDAWYGGLPQMENNEGPVTEYSSESSTQSADGTTVSLRRYLDSMIEL